jgi:hypothetical protein
MNAGVHHGFSGPGRRPFGALPEPVGDDLWVDDHSRRAADGLDWLARGRGSGAGRQFGDARG